MNKTKRIFSLLIFALAGMQTPALSHADSHKSPGTVTTFLKLRAQDTLEAVLLRHGFKRSSLDIIYKQNILGKGFSLSHSNTYQLTVATKADSRQIKFYEPVYDLTYTYWQKGDSAGSQKRKEDLITKTQTVTGKVIGSLLTSIMAKIPNQWVAYRFMDAYAFDYKLSRQLQRGANFRLTLESKWAGKNFIGYGEIRETALEIKNQVEKRYFVSYPGGGTFINPTQTHYLQRPLFSPVSYLRISSYFEPRRLHPIKRRRQPHLGIDFELPEGTHIYAAQSGVILRAGFQRASGNFVVIKHANGFESYYNHLSRISHSIYPGAEIDSGQVIGDIGCTGYCTKAHLHFAVKKNNIFIDPLLVLKNYPLNSQSFIAKQ